VREAEIVWLGIVLASFIIGIYFYPQMPERMASHWNIKGEVDGYLPKFWGLFLMPFISLCIFLLSIAIPKIDPLKYNIDKFRKYYDWFVILVIGLLLYAYLLTIFWNIGIRFSMIQALAPAFGGLFYYCGILAENAKRNWFIGIRTPWTLSNEKVWDKTHRIGGQLLKIAGIIALFGVFFPNYALLFIFVPIISVFAYTITYSYIEYQKEVK